ncbi:MAG: anti-sigma factor [Sphingomonadaceae bacterium]|nr:anti-sigma factor [Sphingomonadaceae bacterium]
MTPLPPDDDMTPDAALALDYALGALDGPALRAAELRLRRDPAFAADVARWQAELGPLADAVAPVAPPSAVWAAVERELFREAPRTDPAPAPGPVARTLALWRGLAFGASAVAAVALALLVVRPGATPPTRPPAPASSGPLLAASMATTDAAKAVVITATWDAARGAVILTPAAKAPSRGLTPELWVITGTDKPQSLGTIDLADPQAHVVSPQLRAKLTKGATLAISLEPAGGSPTGQPTGPVVATGTLTAL